MFPRTNNRKAISVVVTSIIILTASVVFLGTAVVYYSTSMFQTGSQTQSIQNQGIKLWINSTVQTNTPVGNPFSGQNAAWGAAAIRNNGDVLTTVNTIQIRGVTIPFANWYVDSTQARVLSGSNFQASYNLTRTDQYGNPLGTATNGGVVNNALLGTCTGQTPRNTLPYTTIVMQTDRQAVNAPLCLQQVSAPVTLNPGAAMIVFFKLPRGLISPVDAGSTITTSIYAGNAGGPITITIGNP